MHLCKHIKTSVKAVNVCATAAQMLEQLIGEPTSMQSWKSDQYSAAEAATIRGLDVRTCGVYTFGWKYRGVQVQVLYLNTHTSSYFQARRWEKKAGAKAHTDQEIKVNQILQFSHFHSDKTKNYFWIHVCVWNKPLSKCIPQISGLVLVGNWATQSVLQ